MLLNTHLNSRAWSNAVGSIPQLSLGTTFPGLPEVVKEDELREWAPYTGASNPIWANQHQPSNACSVFAGFCGVSIVIYNSNYVLFPGIQPVDSRDILEQYTQYLAWYISLPLVLRVGQNSTPSVFFVHLYYQYTLILLFFPYIDMAFYGSSISPRDVCTDAADAISVLIRSYDKLYSLRRTPCFLPYIVFAAGIVHLTTATPSKIDNIDLGPIKFLEDMVLCHTFAKQGSLTLQNMGGIGAFHKGERVVLAEMFKWERATSPIFSYIDSDKEDHLI